MHRTIPEKFDVFETQNYLYKELFSENEDMLEKVSTQKEKTEDDENKVIYRYTMRVNEKSYLYLYGNEGENLIYKIIVNGETVTIPWINNQNNTWYSLSSNNGIINLGKFENQDVEEVKNLIKNQTINNIERKGKWLIFCLDDYYLLSHLRMEGKYIFKPLND